MVTDVFTGVSTATTASITTINKKLKQVRSVETVKNSLRFLSCGVCEMIVILIYQYCIDFDENEYNNNENYSNKKESNNEKENQKENQNNFSSQIALWACRAIGNLAKNPSLKSKFTEIGVKEMISTLTAKFSKSKNVVEWIYIARDSLN